MSRPELDSALTQARQLPIAELTRLLGDLEEVRATALARLTTPVVPAPSDELIDVRAAAVRLGVSRDYLYRHHNQFPFTRREGSKLLFSSLGIATHIRGRNKTY